MRENLGKPLTEESYRRIYKAMKKTNLETAKNLARLIVADANEGLGHNSSDETEFEVEIIVAIRRKASRILALLEKL